MALRIEDARDLLTLSFPLPVCEVHVASYHALCLSTYQKNVLHVTRCNNVEYYRVDYCAAARTGSSERQQRTRDEQVLAERAAAIGRPTPRPLGTAWTKWADLTFD